MKQDGMSLTGYIISIALLAFFVTIALKLVPVYIEHYYVVHSLERLQAEASTLPEQEIKSRLMKDFSINDVDTVDRKQINVRRVDSKTIDVSIEYDVQRQLIANIDVLIHFSNSVELKQ
jgi:Tfp pilus assembly major pilin PilA